MFNSNVTARKSGPFRDWDEDHATVDITLPLPEEALPTTKKDLVVVIAAEKLAVRHVRLEATLLRAEPTAGLIDPEESTWYLNEQGDFLHIVLGKQWRGETKSDQYWGASLASKGGTVECYLTPAEVSKRKAAREKADKEIEQAHRARVQASEQARRDSEAQKAAEAAREEQKAEARRRRREKLLAEAEAEAVEERTSSSSADRRKRAEPPPSTMSQLLDWRVWAMAIAAAAALVLLQEGVQAVRGGGGATAARPRRPVSGGGGGHAYRQPRVQEAAAPDVEATWYDVDS